MGDNVEQFMEKVDVSKKGGIGEVENWEKAKVSYNQYDGIVECNRADILTSIKTPINTCLELIGYPTGSGRGIDIKKRIMEYDRKAEIIKDRFNELLPYFKAFGSVYYWYGNMMPVPRNFSAGSNDTWKYKLDRIKEWWDNTEALSEEKSYERVFRKWIEKYKNEKKSYTDFIRNNFLIDMVDENSLKTKWIESLASKTELGEKTEDERIEVMKNWFVKNSKIIIQRSYRISQKNKVELNENDIENIQSVFSKIFKGMNVPKELF